MTLHTPHTDNTDMDRLRDVQRRTALANIITGKLSPLGKLEAVDRLLAAEITRQVTAELELFIADIHKASLEFKGDSNASMLHDSDAILVHLRDRIDELNHAATSGDKEN